jgi:hypothetical protein
MSPGTRVARNRLPAADRVPACPGDDPEAGIVAGLEREAEAGVQIEAEGARHVEPSAERYAARPLPTLRRWTRTQPRG